MQELTDVATARARQHSLLLAGAARPSALDVVTWFGAMQSQDAASGQWSLGIRLPGSTIDDVEASFMRGEILRTWPMRGTIHTVPARDTRWMLELTGSRALSGSMGRREQLGLDPASARRALPVLETALAAGARLTRAQTLAALEEAGIDTSGQRGYHLLGYAAHLGVICIGPSAGKEQTFVLLADWAPSQVELSRDDALAELAHRYFRSHGPATMKDFAGWTGLTLTDARAAVAANAGRLVPVRFRSDECWLTVELDEALREGLGQARTPVVAPPGFDEFILGFKDRRPQLSAEHMEAIVPGSNGMFRSTLCIDGRARGVWTRSIKRTRVEVSLQTFEPLGPRLQRQVDAALARYGEFLGLPVTRVEAVSPARQRRPNDDG